MITHFKSVCFPIIVTIILPNPSKLIMLFWYQKISFYKWIFLIIFLSRNSIAKKIKSKGINSIKLSKNSCLIILSVFFNYFTKIWIEGCDHSFSIFHIIFYWYWLGWFNDMSMVCIIIYFINSFAKRSIAFEL